MPMLCLGLGKLGACSSEQWQMLKHTTKVPETGRIHRNILWIHGFPSGHCGISLAPCRRSHEESPSSEFKVGIQSSATRGQERIKFQRMAFEFETLIKRNLEEGVIKHKGLQIKIWLKPNVSEPPLVQALKTTFFFLFKEMGHKDWLTLIFITH